MITAIVLINAEVHRIPEVAEAIAGLDGVTEVYSVAGDADLIAMVRVRAHEELDDVITGRPQDGWLATWSLADGVASHPIDGVEIADVVAGVARSLGA